jgi:hypothetical protein
MSFDVWMCRINSFTPTALTLVSFFVLLYYLLETVTLLGVMHLRKQAQPEPSGTENDLQRMDLLRPVVPFVYAIFSALVIYQLIDTLGGMRLMILEKVGRYVPLSSETEPTLEVLFVASMASYLVFAAFAVNFAKSFHTFTSLELGYIANRKLPQLLQGWRRIFEFAHRLVNVALFVLLEHSLIRLHVQAESPVSVQNGDLLKGLACIGIIGVILYLSVVVWGRRCSKDVFKADRGSLALGHLWNLQLFMGALVCFALWLLGFTEQNQWMRTNFVFISLAWAPTVLIGSTLIILIVFGEVFFNARGGHLVRVILSLFKKAEVA